MENCEPSRLTVDEFLRLANGILALAGVTTRLSADDQFKLDGAVAALDGNNQRVADVLNQQT